ncbi:Cystathionine beta-lyase PatB [Calidithermus terrae]|uniref:cysteine-S-conjugate beta-lyase n=1 Tax=Calidithermus terrae TaxID=1408545 RepID=A0A399EF18_9DEIN|nr:MalY/PatB family protein [Calidithermus terrae]RIH83234.1 Cystathionine beta-lyase PatB [Calidithermus terrae]
MPHPFDELNLEEVKGSHSVKWSLFPEDVLPLWVADMDYPVAEPILEAVRERLSRRIGYPQGAGDPELLEAIIAKQERLGLKGLQPENLWLTSSVVPGICASVLALSSPGDEAITQVPVYHPFLIALKEFNRVTRANPMQPGETRWEIDFEQLESLVTPGTRMLMLCNPQNPTGRVFTRAELERLAEFALRHRLWVMVDELWSDLIYEGPHVPFASLSEEVAQRTVTLTGPCKAFNTAGLGGGVAISHNKEILARMQKVSLGIGGHPNVLSMAAWLGALRHGQPWLEQTLAYLKANRDFLTRFLAERLPEVRYTPPEATYLAWLDFRALGLEDPHAFALEHAKVGLNDGAIFGEGFKGYLRLNFATSRPLLQEALERLASALKGSVVDS